MDETRSYWAWAVSSTLHGVLLLILILGFASAPQFHDNEEAIPVATVSNTQFNEIMNGEKTAKPAPEPPPAPKTETPPEPPQPPPQLRAAEDPTPKPEPTPPPKPAPTPPEKSEPPPKPEPSPSPKLAENAPEPPQRPKEPTPEKPQPDKTKPDPIAKVVEKEKSDAKPAQRYDPNAIAKLIAPKSPASGSGSAANAAATPQGLPRHNAPKMSVSMASALDAWLTENYLSCWTPPPTMPDGDVYVAEIKVVFNADGSLSTRPVLLNPPTDPAWRAHAESAMRAVRRCDPLRVPPEYAPFFEEWKIETIHFDPRETQG